ncbi:hypothetical protein FA95DRAFT_1535620 [Auriscalpium vulgare]|uniref:Uncharacterized protein n=1 Tax=Auriscalpium vulgare TaxID=40419 RepID=A0ACB8S414_9AGAM|nr:hypothetical protein FA95DRAFT_1535620 [Auriscalpium vulgare]
MSRASELEKPKDANQANSTYAALARTLTRSLALYFSRPVRLFRPSKISGWQSLRGLAQHTGTSLNPQFIAQLVKTHGFAIFPKHFIPPLMVNALLGTVLWATYAETSAVLAPHMSASPIAVAALSGGVAGGMQAVVAAPAENLRLAIEGGSVRGGGGWSHAWKEVFRGTEPAHLTKEENLAEIRQVRNWMREVREMAGRGWDGWGWGFVKDVCGFAVFFSVFEVTRRVAATTKTVAQDFVRSIPIHNDRHGTIRRHTPRVIHAMTLVSGGVVAGLSYELLSRPWDVARRLIYLDRVQSEVKHTSRHYLVTTLASKLREDGPLSFFRAPTAAHDPQQSHSRRRLHTALRTLARVGPWGVGFLVWEAFGPGIA